jgi:hypothetical protein
VPIETATITRTKLQVVHSSDNISNNLVTLQKQIKYYNFGNMISLLVARNDATIFYLQEELTIQVNDSSSNHAFKCMSARIVAENNQASIQVLLSHLVS